jgi:caa(3)-type oxidase subunit IV
MDEQSASNRRHAAESGLKYVIAVVALLVLTALSFALHYASLGGVVGTTLALVIAAVKVGIVALVFMELRDSLPATRLVAAVSVAFVALLCLGIIGDVALR